MAKKITKEDLISALVKKLGVSKREAGDALNTILAEITLALKKGQTVTLPGFGTFSVAKRKARAGRNPKTGEKIRIPAKKVPKFKPGKQLKEAVK